MLLEPAADHERDRIGVAIDGVEALARVLAARDEAAVAGADGIDEDEIGEVEPGLGVRLHLGRGRRRQRFAIERQPPRPGRAELKPCRGRAGPAVEQERHGARRAVGAVELVGRIGDVGQRLALVVEHADRAGGRREIERAAGQIERLLRGRIRRQTVRLGAAAIGDALRAAAAPALLSGRRRRLGARLRRIVRARKARERESRHRQHQGRAAERRQTRDHDRSPCPAVESRCAPKG